MKLTKDTVGLWYFQVNETTDWLAHLFKIDDGAFKLETRFRYYDPDDPGNDAFSIKDRKSWYELTIREQDVAVVLKKVRFVVMMMEKQSNHGEPAVELLMDEQGVDGLIDRLKAQPFAHTQTIPKVPQSELH